MVDVRFVCVIRVSVCPVCVPAPPGVFLPMKKVRRCDLCARVSHVSRVRACPGSTPGVFEPSDGKSDQHGRDRSLGKPKGSRRGCNGDGGALA